LRPRFPVDVVAVELDLFVEFDDLALDPEGFLEYGILFEA